MNIKFSLVLPCYNEEKNIKHLYSEFEKLPKKNENVELIFVNNGSYDSTETEIDDVIKKNEVNGISNIKVRKINLEKNQNYSGGVITGLNSAKGEFIGWSHADLQTPLEDFYKLYNKIMNQKDVLGKGYRVNRGGLDNIITKLHEICASIILGYKMKEINAAPKIFHRNLLQIFSNMPTSSTLLDTYIVYICKLKNITITEINVEFKKRIYGESKWKNNIRNLIKHLFINFYYILKLRFSNDNNKT